MIDWLETILKLILPQEEEPEDPPALPPEQEIYLPKTTQQKATWRDDSPTTLQERAAAAESALLGARSVLQMQSVPPRIQDVTSRIRNTSPLTRALLRGEPMMAATIPGEDGTPSAEMVGPLPLLYRQTVEGAEGIRRTGNFSGTHGQERVVVVQEDTISQSGLTVGELDRAMRRDSRRYDGGMTIY